MGSEMCIRDSLRIAGVDAIGNKKLGKWGEYHVGGRIVEFMAVARLDHSDLKRKRPHSAWVAAGLARYRPAEDSDVVNTHRIHLGAMALRLYPRAAHVQYLHGSGVDDLQAGSVSVFRHATSLYRRLERFVIPRTADTVVFNRAGAERLQSLAAGVRFSPNWYDAGEV